jgi:lon-related putative ATP-dependent protease
MDGADDTGLDASRLRTRCDPDALGFATTDELTETDTTVGHARALDAIRFGVGIRQEGYNVFALGPSASGRHAVVMRLVREQAAREPTPTDTCYVNNFDDPHKPRALVLPAGLGVELRKDMAQLVQEFGSAVPEALESDEYQTRRQEVEETFKTKQEQAFLELQTQANANDVRLLRTPAGFAFAPMKRGEVLKPDDYERLPQAERDRIESNVSTLQEQLDRVIQQMPRWRREMQQEIRKLNRDVVSSVVRQLMHDERRKFEHEPAVTAYFDGVERDVIEHADHFRRPEENRESPFAALFAADVESRQPFVHRYQVNVLVDHTGNHGAPVVYVDNPTYPALVGRVEHQAQLGALITDFTMIKPGALHEANGGYLVLDARKVLMQPYAWEGLKRVLRSREIVIESLGQVLSLVSTVSLEPERIPLDVKVVLVGERALYYLLCAYDEEFEDLFKVAADFDEDVARTRENDARYAAFVASFVRREKLRPLQADAVARLIEHASRLVEDADKLSTRFGRIADCVREADYWAAEAGQSIVRATDVERALDAREQRHARIRERLLESTLRGTFLIATDGAVVGQVNGLSVLALGEHGFGHPTRITARVRHGRGEVVDIEREVELGGPLHSKGVLILSGFLAGRYCPDEPLSLHASVVFEQSYGPVEGDSASAAELFALLSALADVPIQQSFAVTGSVDQHGAVQAIGGVNEKIEGFFDVCAKRGLTGRQGVLIPAANVRHLMLRQDVVDAVAAGRFSVHAIATVDEGIARLTGLPAGARDADGHYPEGSVNQHVEARLLAMAEQARNRGGQDDEQDAS